MLTAATIKHLNQLQQKKYRAEFKEFIVEGVKGVKEAIESDAEIIIIIIDGKLRDEPEFLELVKMASAHEIAFDFCSRADIGEIKTTDTFPGVLAVVSSADIGLDEIARGTIIAPQTKLFYYLAVNRTASVPNLKKLLILVTLSVEIVRPNH